MLTSFIAPAKAHASLFNTIASFFGSNIEEFSASDPNKNSQNIALLKAPNSLKSSVGGGDVTIVDSTAIEPALNAVGDIGSDTHLSASQISLYYVVRKDDTISQIAKMFGVSVNTIVWANDLSGNILSEDQTLVILPISGVQHSVKSGDTVESIAKKYKSDAGEIRQFNDLSIEDKLVVGDIVLVPDGEAVPVIAKASTKSSGVLKNLLPIRSVSVGYYINPAPSARRSQGLHGYNGVDLAAPTGTPLLASAGGTIIVSKNTGWNRGYGIYVVIAHDNGTQTLYAHMSRTIVSAGMRVVQGQVIGSIGSTGKSTGPHVHFEIRGAVNPF